MSSIFESLCWVIIKLVSRWCPHHRCLGHRAGIEMQEEVFAVVERIASQIEALIVIPFGIAAISIYVSIYLGSLLLLLSLIQFHVVVSVIPFGIEQTEEAAASQSGSMHLSNISRHFCTQ
ncbi:hypothetical protein L6164_005604 [Bauhinia variegata]|uniref:Uncharacterized protein n=1 Tax=Bauhinia variegata TaxID=167791 RepID=A0ACB9PUF4_BAUVA|nr:hypothetical protein L6164_005604 [Bauhinia variegata]